MYYQWWHMDPNMVNLQMMYYYRWKPYKIRHRHSSYLGTTSISNNKNELKPNFESIVSNAFEMNNIQDSDLKKALTKALEQAIDYDQIYKFVREKMKSDKHDDDAHYSEQARQMDRNIRILPRPSPSAPEGSWLEPPKHEG
ncbi:hypothetical protein JIR001_14480 [Polycladomyces abyssicola]|uniref:Uncharacterized protein n=1 Tax=Polycladomyces abyssicola TaxID=1125966 RepID=A0A8D5UEG0_9BACL|nr:hypothetical protein [Polycladomyces abyssicola]BCU81665.1 hypothetical protein JIR001_14480 [Polycladomyces abyssicola]